MKINPINCDKLNEYGYCIKYGVPAERADCLGCTSKEITIEKKDGLFILSYRHERFEIVPGENGFFIGCGNRMIIAPQAANKISVSTSMIMSGRDKIF